MTSSVKLAYSAATHAINEDVRSYAAANIFRSHHAPSVEDNPFRRPLLTPGFDDFDIQEPIASRDLLSNSSLVANRLLMSIYERDFVFLPNNDLAGKWKDFEEFYSEDLRVAGELIRARLEPFVFRSVERELSISGPWNLESFEAYFEDFRNGYTAPGNQAAMDAITGSPNAVAAAQLYLIQLAGDFLVESSAMARNAIGNFGRLQSELFKVIIDECGYGVHPTRHSTLFQKVLVSRGLSPVPHAYWEFYLPSSFYLNNYYGYICRNHRHLFRYFGAILQVETAFGVTCSQMAKMMNTVFGPDAETQYFLEHVHIDNHHSRMVLEEIVRPAVKLYGDSILSDILRGFEESRIIGDLFVRGLKTQIAWLDSISSGHDGCRPLRLSSVSERNLQWTGTQMSNRGLDVHIESGEMDVVAGYELCATYGAGQCVSIPADVLYALCPSSDCKWELTRHV